MSILVTNIRKSQKLPSILHALNRVKLVRLSQKTTLRSTVAHRLRTNIDPGDLVRQHILIVSAAEDNQNSFMLFIVTVLNVAHLAENWQTH